MNVLLENDTFVSELRDALREGASGLSSVPDLLKDVLRNGRWKVRTIRTGESAEFEFFEDFVTTPPLQGLGTNMGLIKRICADDPEAIDLLDQALAMGVRQGNRTRTDLFSYIGESTQSENGTNNLVYNIHEVNCRPYGTSVQRAHRRLRKDRPDLHARVLAGEISAHRAMIEAGFLKPTATIPLDLNGAARALRRHFSGDDLKELIALLNQ